MHLMPSETISISIARNRHDVYRFVSNLKNLPKWATTFCLSIRKAGRDWVARTPQGPMIIQIEKKNRLGVVDHVVIPAPGIEVFVPMRVIRNGQGSKVLFTLFQSPGMTAKDHARDLKMVRQDLATLKKVLER